MNKFGLALIFVILAAINLLMLKIMIELKANGLILVSYGLPSVVMGWIYYSTKSLETRFQKITFRIVSIAYAIWTLWIGYGLSHFEL